MEEAKQEDGNSKKFQARNKHSQQLTSQPDQTINQRINDLPCFSTLRSMQSQARLTKAKEAARWSGGESPEYLNLFSSDSCAGPLLHTWFCN